MINKNQGDAWTDVLLDPFVAHDEEYPVTYEYMPHQYTITTYSPDLIFKFPSTFSFGWADESKAKLKISVDTSVAYDYLFIITARNLITQVSNKNYYFYYRVFCPGN